MSARKTVDLNVISFSVDGESEIQRTGTCNAVLKHCSVCITAGV